MQNVTARLFVGESAVDHIALTRVPCVGEEIMRTHRGKLIAHYRVESVIHETGNLHEGTVFMCRCQVFVIKSPVSGAEDFE